MAARRAGIKRIILPNANKRDFDEMPDYLKDNLEPHFVEEYDEVFNVAFGRINV
jgi:ATP-dependent Lon protease